MTERWKEKARKLLERHVEQIPFHECWEWRGDTSLDGYGRCTIDEVYTYGHRVSYQLFHGGISKGMQIDHLCRNRGCCNPAHLEMVTCKENVLRGEGITARQARSVECINGHPLSGENLYVHNGKRYCKICRSFHSRNRGTP